MSMSITNIVFDLEGVVLEWVNSNEVKYYPEILDIIEDLEEYNLYFLTNIHTRSGPHCDNTIIPYLLKKGFQGGLASHKSKFKKPQKEFYQQFLDRFRLDAKECLFIDDKIINTSAAAKLGFKVITNKPNVTDLREKIKTITIGDSENIECYKD
jgi:HAD superfamily hydrolase (TIGR01509 family)